MAMYNHWAERLANTNTGIFLANDSSEIVLPWTLVFFYYNTPPCNLQSFSGQNALFVFINSLCIKIKNFLCELRPKFDLQMFRNIISNQNHSIRNQIVFYHVICEKCLHSACNTLPSCLWGNIFKAQRTILMNPGISFFIVFRFQYPHLFLCNSIS